MSNLSKDRELHIINYHLLALLRILSVRIYFNYRAEDLRTMLSWISPSSYPSTYLVLTFEAKSPPP